MASERRKALGRQSLRADRNGTATGAPPAQALRQTSRLPFRLPSPRQGQGRDEVAGRGEHAGPRVEPERHPAPIRKHFWPSRPFASRRTTPDAIRDRAACHRVTGRPRGRRHRADRSESRGEADPARARVSFPARIVPSPGATVFHAPSERGDRRAGGRPARQLTQPPSARHHRGRFRSRNRWLGDGASLRWARHGRSASADSAQRHVTVLTQG